jgi:hypothetical protein
MPLARSGTDKVAMFLPRADSVHAFSLQAAIGQPESQTLASESVLLEADEADIRAGGPPHTARRLATAHYRLSPLFAHHTTLFGQCLPAFTAPVAAALMLSESDTRSGAPVILVNDNS